MVGEREAWVLAPAGARLPMEEVGALGRLGLFGRVDAADALTAEQRPAVIRDIDARGYGIVAADELSGLAQDGPAAATEAAVNADPEQRIAA